MTNPSVVSAITAILGAGGATIILKLIDVASAALTARSKKKKGKLTLEEKIEAMSVKQDSIEKKVREIDEKMKETTKQLARASEQISKTSEQLDMTDKLVLATAHDRIVFLCRKKAEDKHFSQDDVDDIDVLYGPYHADGGNSGATEAFEVYKAQRKAYMEKEATL